jgi:hypothetical protein
MKMSDYSHHSYVVQWSQEDGAFKALVPELGVTAIGSTAEEAMRAARSAADVKVATRPVARYAVGNRVKVNTWTKPNHGVIADIKWTYHPRMGEWVWGYSVTLDPGEQSGLTFNYIPEGYLQLEDTR